MTDPAAAVATVVVVDDDVSVRESVVGLMRWAGYAVQAYASTTEFMHKMGAASLAELVRMADALALPRTHKPR